MISKPGMSFMVLISIASPVSVLAGGRRLGRPTGRVVHMVAPWEPEPGDRTREAVAGLDDVDAGALAYVGMSMGARDGLPLAAAHLGRPG